MVYLNGFFPHTMGKEAGCIDSQDSGTDIGQGDGARKGGCVVEILAVLAGADESACEGQGTGDGD